MKPTTPGNATALFLLLPQSLGATLAGDAVPSLRTFLGWVVTTWAQSACPHLHPPSHCCGSAPVCDPQHPSWSLNHGTVQQKGAQPASPSPRYLSLASPLAGGSVSRLINARHRAPTAPGVQPPPAGKSSLAAGPGEQGECGRVVLGP